MFQSKNHLLCLERISGGHFYSAQLGMLCLTCRSFFFVLWFNRSAGWLLVLVPLCSLALYYIWPNARFALAASVQCNRRSREQTARIWQTNCPLKLAFIQLCIASYWLQAFRESQLQSSFVFSVGSAKPLYLDLLFHWRGFNAGHYGVGYRAYLLKKWWLRVV